MPAASAHNLRTSLQHQADQRRAATLWRTRPDVSPHHVDLASNDYLNLSTHPALIAAAQDAAERYGVGGRASPLVADHSDLRRRVEQAFTSFKKPNASDHDSLFFANGFAANLGVLTALAHDGDLVLLDKLSHASLMDAARFSGATVRSFAHLDVQRLSDLLTRKRGSFRRCFVVTDSVFSMDGDGADLPALCDLCEQHDATLIVDEAHGTGVLGPTGRGLAEVQGVLERIPIVITTCGKALGGAGGVVTAHQTIIDALLNHARSLVYSTSPPPPQLAAAAAALDVVQREPERRERLHHIIQRFHKARVSPHPGFTTPIIPLITGDPDAALTLQHHLHDAGFRVAVARPPTVPPAASRVRLSLHSALTDEQVDRLLEALTQPGRLRSPG